MGKLTAEHYRAQLLALLPSGAAWRKESGSNLYRFVDALAQEFARVQARADGAQREALPAQTWEMLSDWEQAAGLPDECTPMQTDPTARRNELISRLKGQGGQSAAYFIELLAAKGYAGARISQPRALTVNGNCNGSLWHENSKWWWIVHLPASSQVVRATANSGCNAFLGYFAPSPAKCILNKLKPAHTQVSVRLEN